MTSLPVLLADLGPVWHVALIVMALGLWAFALRYVLRDLRRRTTTGSRLARCGLPAPAALRPRRITANGLRRGCYHLAQNGR